MPKLRHSGRLPMNAGQIVGCDRIVLPATNNTTVFSYEQGNNIARFEIPPSVGMISPFKMPRLCGELAISGVDNREETPLLTINPYLGLEGLVHQVVIRSLRGGAVLADTRFYERQVSSCVYNSQGTIEQEHNHMCNEFKAMNNIAITDTLLSPLWDAEVTRKLNFSIPLTTNLLESPQLLATHLYGLGQGLQIEIYFSSDESFFQVIGDTRPTYQITNLRLHYDLLRFDPGSVSTSGMKQIMFESIDSRNDTIQSNDETRNVPLVGSAVQSIVIDALPSANVNTYRADSNAQEFFGLNTLRFMVAGQSLPIQQELGYATQNQVTRTGIAPIQRENFKAITHDAEVSHPRSMLSQEYYEGIAQAFNDNTKGGLFSCVLPFTSRHTFGVLFGKEGVPMRYGNLSFRVQSTNPYYQATPFVAASVDAPKTPSTDAPYTLYTHITSLKMLNVDEGSGLVSVQS
jgi:hypothetical protein